MPLQGCSGEWCDLGRPSPFDVDRQHDTIAVGVMAGKAIGLRGPAVPALGMDLFEAMPIAEGDVVQLTQQSVVQAQLVLAAGKVVSIGVQVLGAEAMDGAMGQEDSGAVAREGLPIDAAHPSGRVLAVRSAQ